MTPHTPKPVRSDKDAQHDTTMEATRKLSTDFSTTSPNKPTDINQPARRETKSSFWFLFLPSPLAEAVQTIDGLTWTNQENGCVHLGDQLFGYRADNEAFQPTTISRSHHQQVGTPFCGRIGNGLCNAM